ncbi:hypothetical protein BH11MYX4_BH11MYX4_39710 [soil metagenome]
MSLRALSALALVAAGSSAAFACGSSDGASSSGAVDSGGIVDCPDDVPAACPAGAPTYAKDIGPLIQGSCATCHAPGGRQSSRLLTTYDQVFAQRGAILTQVNACRMPPRDGTPLTAGARKALLAWLVCGAKND